KLAKEAITKLSQTFGIDADAPFSKLPKKHRELILSGPPAGGTRGGVKLARPLRRVDDVKEDDEDEGEEELELPKRRGRRAAADDPWGRGFEGGNPNLRRRYEEGSRAGQEARDPY